MDAVSSTAPFLKIMTIDADATLTSLHFTQTGAATLTPTGFNTGTYSIAGNLGGILSFPEFLINVPPQALDEVTRRLLMHR